MTPVSFIICNYNATEYFRFCYESLRRNLSPEHEIVLLDDGSDDPSARQWMRSLDDPNAVLVENPENIGIAYSYNAAVDAASNPLVCVLHSDMYVPPGFDAAMVRAMEDHDFICAHRVEPPLYPPSADKTVADFGNDPDSFDEPGLLAWVRDNGRNNAGRTSGAMFFPWMTRREFITGLGGVDLLFLKYMVDDDDLYLRARLAGARMCQVLETAVYHFGSRSTLHAGTVQDPESGMESGEESGKKKAAMPSAWQAQYYRSQRNFLRKWGRHSSSFWTGAMEIVARPKYDLGIVAPGADLEQVRALEPLASNLYIDSARVRKEYLDQERDQTMLHLAERVRLLERGAPHNGVVLELDPATADPRFLEQSLPALLDKGPAPGSYQLGEGGQAMQLTVRSLVHSQQEQIVNTRRFSYAANVPEREFRQVSDSP